MAIPNTFADKTGEVLLGNLDYNFEVLDVRISNNQTQIENLDLRIDAIEGTDVDFTGYATETYVDNAINAISLPSLSGYATETYVNTQVSNLVNSAPSTLDTLNELAAALGDDANFSTTITNSIADKAPISNPTFTGNITVNGDILVDEIRARTNQDLTITCGESFGSLTDASNNDEIIRLAGEGGVKVYASSDNLGSGLNRVTTLIDTSGNMSLAGSITPSGAATIRDVTGNYGSLEIDGAATGGWEGYSIGGWSVFMSQGTSSGIYNDVNNQWILYGVHNAATDIRYAGSAKLTTTSTGVSVTGTCSATSFTGDGSALTGIGLPSGTTAQRPVSPTTGETRYNTDLQSLEFWNGSEWRRVQDSTSSVYMTGGSVYESDGYRYHKFTSSGTLNVSLANNVSVEYLVVAGGGSGANQSGAHYGPGGGGAGGMRTGTTTVNSGNSFTITIGAGGAAIPQTNSSGNNGSNSVGLGITSTGGGGGSGPGGTSRSGGSGGGGCSVGPAPGSGTSGQGNAGGNSYQGGTTDRCGGGGGGKSSVGGNGTPGPYAGSGGAGELWVDGNYYAGGGGSATSNQTAGFGNGSGGIGGGGAGQNNISLNATSGTVNTGGGGGAHGNQNGVGGGSSGAGGSGVVIIRYQI